MGSSHLRYPEVSHALPTNSDSSPPLLRRVDPACFHRPAPPAVLAECPQNLIRCGAFSDDQDRMTSAARDSVECSEAGDTAGAYYDLTLGWLVAGASGGDISAFARASAHDRYQIIGVEPGTAVSLVAEMGASGGAGAYGHCAFSPYASVSATLERDDGTRVRVSAGSSYSYPDCTPVGSGSLSATLQLPLEVIAGEEFGLHMEVTASASWGDGTASMSGLAFSGLPPGASIVSCQGFLQESPVQALQASWGRVKSIYR